MRILATWVVGLSLVHGAEAAQRAGALAPGRGETYRSAAVAADGRLAITTTEGRTIVVPKVEDQSGYSEPRVSPDRRAVGAQAVYPNCCTSYDIPLELVVYADRRAHRFTGDGLAIFRWRFADGGSRVAYGQEPVHFGCSVHYQLRDVRSERLIDSADVPEPCGQVPDPPAVKIPAWVAELVADRK